MRGETVLGGRVDEEDGGCVDDLRQTSVMADRSSGAVVDRRDAAAGEFAAELCCADAAPPVEVACHADQSVR
ncbi:MAG: hypothetical protein GEV07_05865 [Streptosporangiales bacterium]|nr:hypothetical protein [Streptosporangiales bacterium]